MRLNVKALAFSCGIFCSVLFTLCAVLIWLMPNFTINLFSLFFHGISLEAIYNPDVNFIKFILGLILTFFSAVIGSVIFGRLYNKFTGRQNQ